MKPDLGLDRHPLIVAIAGPNGAGKSTFFRGFIAPSELLFVNADVIALRRGLSPYVAAEAAERIRRRLVARKKSFAFETVLSDPEGEKVKFLEEVVEQGYHVVLCFVGIASAAISDDRVTIRVSKGGHDVPRDKLAARYPRTMANLARAIRVLPRVFVFDNSDLAQPYLVLAEYQDGRVMQRADVWPGWFREIAEQERV